MFNKLMTWAAQQPPANGEDQTKQRWRPDVRHIRLVALLVCLGLFTALALQLASAQEPDPLVYWVFDAGTRDSQFGFLDPNDPTVPNTIGGVFNNFDIEGISCIGTQIYGVSGLDGAAPSKLYRVTLDILTDTSTLEEIGAIQTAAGEPFFEVSSLAEKGNELWGFAAEGPQERHGIISINPANGEAVLEKQSDLDVAGVAWVGEVLWLSAGANFYSWAPGGEITFRFSVPDVTQIEALDSFRDPNGAILLYYGGDGITGVRVVNPATGAILPDRMFVTPDDIESFTFCQSTIVTKTPTSTATTTNTPTPTNTATATSTNTATATPTSTSTNTATPTNTPTPTITTQPGKVNLGNLVWHDANNNGLRDPAEAGIDGVVVQLFLAGQTPGIDDPLATTTTAGGGIYNFTNLDPGDYFVYIPTAPALYPVSSTATTTTDNGVDNDDNGSQPDGSGAPVQSPVINLALGAEPTIDGDGPDGDLTIDFGFFAPVRVGDYVWYDDDGDGVQDPDEPGVPNVTVRLFTCEGAPAMDVNGQPVTVQVTGPDGQYLFLNLLPGSYYVVFDTDTLPIGVVITVPDQGGNDETDSDANPGPGGTPGQTPCTPFIPSGQNDLSLDMGVIRPVTVGDFVWYDNDNDGLQDANEAGVEGVTVQIFNANGAPALHLNGTVVGPQVTDASGRYLFTNLAPGSYFVVFNIATLPAGYVVTTPNAGADDAIDSDASPGSGQTLPTPFLPGGSEDLTLDMGIIQVPGTVRVGDYVWLDSNANGAQDPGERGVSGVTVTLFDAGSNLQLGTDVTDASGLYLFDNLPPGQYYVVFDLTTLPAGYLVTTPNASAVPDDQDSDADPTTGRSGNSQTLAAGQEDLTLDMGVYELVSVGNLVWEDPNNNGLVDSGETGMPNIPVRLYTLGGSLVATTTTDANGNYRFIDLIPGSYYIEVDVPPGYSSSTGAAPFPYEPAPDPDNDIDNDDNGTALRPITTTLQSLPVTLGAGQEPDPNDPNYNPTVDFGVCQGCNPTGQVDRSALGDFVWRDRNCDGIQDITEVGVPNVTVNLRRPDGTLVESMVTDVNGNYRFDNLAAGNYIVEFIKPPGFTFSPLDQGGNNAGDSDADVTTGQTTLITLPENVTDITWDAGLCATPTDLPPEEEPAQLMRAFLPIVR